MAPTTRTAGCPTTSTSALPWSRPSGALSCRQRWRERGSGDTSTWWSRWVPRRRPERDQQALPRKPDALLPLPPTVASRRRGARVARTRPGGPQQHAGVTGTASRRRAGPHRGLAPERNDSVGAVGALCPHLVDGGAARSEFRARASRLLLQFDEDDMGVAIADVVAGVLLCRKPPRQPSLDLYVATSAVRHVQPPPERGQGVHDTVRVFVRRRPSTRMVQVLQDANALVFEDHLVEARIGLGGIQAHCSSS